MNHNNISGGGRNNIDKYFYERSLPNKYSVLNDNNNTIKSEFNVNNYPVDAVSSLMIRNDSK